MKIKPTHGFQRRTWPPRRSVVRTAGVPAIPLHGARHSYAETALRAGARLDVVSRQLGHASIATTATIYIHDADDSADEVAELLATLFDARKGNLGGSALNGEGAG